MIPAYKEIVEPKYDSVSFFADGMCLVSMESDNLFGNNGFVDITGTEVVPLEYEKAGSFSDDLAMVCLDDKYGFIDKTGEESIPFKYEDAFGFHDGLAVV